jgi:hypothetical protein
VGQRTIEELRDELKRLMLKQIESLRKQAFGGLSDAELAEQEERLKQVREVSADFLAALERGDS